MNTYVPHRYSIQIFHTRSLWTPTIYIYMRVYFSDIYIFNKY